MREAWAVNLKKLRIPFRWIVHRENHPEKTVRQIQPEGIVLLLNDHHLDDLTSRLCDQGSFGRGKDGSIWVGLATEKVVGSVFPRSEEKTRLCARLCHLVAHFDPMAAGVISSEGAIPLFCHQYADTETFQPRRRYEQKNEGIFWAGKLKVGDFSEAYRDRVALFEGIKDLPGFSWREATNPEKRINHIVSEKDAYQGLLNLPSNCPGFTSNFFENLAMGACVLQHDVFGPHPEGLEPGVHYLAYNKSQPESLRELTATFMAEPGRFQKMAELGREICVTHHSLAARLAEILSAPAWQSILQSNISSKAAAHFHGLLEKIR